MFFLVFLRKNKTVFQNRKNAFKKGMWKTGKYVKDKKIKERMKKMKTKSYEKLRNIRIKKKWQEVKNPTINSYKQQINKTNTWVRPLKVQILVPSMDQRQRQIHTISFYIIFNKS